MKKVILIGDSIRRGYQQFVEELLSGSAEVWGPEKNGGNSENVLAHLDEWVLSKEADVVHMNCGLHDLKKNLENDEPAIPIGQYSANIRRILEGIQQAGDEQIIWALITPVNEKWHHEQKGFDRLEADVSDYNTAALEATNDLTVRVNDLYQVVNDAGRDSLLTPDGVHFTEEGSRILGEAVANAIREVL